MCFSSIWIFFSKVIQKSDCCWVLAWVCTAPMLSKSEKILMSLNSKQKPLCQLATAELFPNETGNSKKWQKHVWVWSLELMVLSLCKHAKPYFFAWRLLTAQAKDPFQESKEWIKGLQCSMRGGPHWVFGTLKATSLGKQIVMNS